MRRENNPQGRNNPDVMNGPNGGNDSENVENVENVEIGIAKKLAAALKNRESPVSIAKMLLGEKPVRYFISSVIAFIVDYAVLLALEYALSGVPAAMEIAAVAAFLCSSQLNFHINRLWVFRSTKGALAQMGGYYGLAAFSFVIKTFVILEILVRLLHIPTWISKPIAEAVMFVFNYFVQKKLIFRIRRGKNTSRNSGTDITDENIKK